MSESLSVQRLQASTSTERPLAAPAAEGAPAEELNTGSVAPDRAAVAEYGSGQAPTTVTFVTTWPPLATVKTAEDVDLLVADMVAVQPKPAGGAVAAVSVTAAVASGPDGLVTAWQSGELVVDDATLQDGAKVALGDGIGMVADAMLAVEAADAVLAANFADLTNEEQAHFTVMSGVAQTGVVLAERYEDQVAGMQMGETTVVVELPIEQVPTVETVPPKLDETIVRRSGLSQKQMGMINRVVAGMAAPDAPGPPVRPARCHQVRMGPGSLDKLQALDQAFSGGDADKARRFLQAVTQAAQGGLRLDDPIHGEVARFLAEALQANPQALGRLIQVEGGVVRLNLGRLQPQNLERLLRMQPVSHVVTLIGQRVAGTSPSQRVQMGELMRLAMSGQGISLSDPRYGPMARELWAQLQGTRETQGLGEIRDGRLFITTSADDAQAIQTFFGYYQRPERSAAAQKVEAAYDQAMAKVTRALDGLEKAIVFLAVYNHVSGAGQEGPVAAGPRAPPDEAPEVPSAPDAEVPEAPPLPPLAPQAPVAGARTVRGVEQAAQANRRQQQLLANALQQSFLDDAKHRRHLDSLRTGATEALQRADAKDEQARRTGE